MNQTSKPFSSFPPVEQKFTLSEGGTVFVAYSEPPTQAKKETRGVWDWAHEVAASFGYELRLNVGGEQNPSAALVPKETEKSKPAYTTLVFPSGMAAVEYLDQQLKRKQK